MTQRLRILFSRSPAAIELAGKDILKAWEAAIAAVQRKQGREDCTRSRLAAALALSAGMTADAEVLDAFLEEPLAARVIREEAPRDLPAGISLVEVDEVGLGLPSLQSDVRWAEYRVRMREEGAKLEAAVGCFMALETLPWEEARETKTRRYDIRAAVLALKACTGADGALEMRLRSDATLTCRPEQVVAALGLALPVAVHRKRIGLATKSPVREAWRRRGRFSE